MKDIRTVGDLIRAKNLTVEELELHKDLIEECLQREKQIKEYSEETERNLRKLTQDLQMIGEKTKRLERAIKTLLEEADNLSLKLLPEEAFYHE